MGTCTSDVHLFLIISTLVDSPQRERERENVPLSIIIIFILSLDKPVMDEFDKLRLKENDFDTKGIIGQGHFGEVSTCTYYAVPVSICHLGISNYCLNA